jgi:hypothetical protein
VSENDLNKNIEEKYIEPSILKNEYIINNGTIEDKNNNNIQVSLQSAYNIDYIYFPKNFK